MDDLVKEYWSVGLVGFLYIVFQPDISILNLNPWLSFVIYLVVQILAITMVKIFQNEGEGQKNPRELTIHF